MERSLLDPLQDPYDPKDTREVHKYAGNLLFEAAERVNGRALRTRRDKIGIICLEYPSFVLVARRYVYQGVVSVHRTIVHYARDSLKKIVMFVDSENGFFVFDPVRILAVSTPNTRGYSESEIMENFSFDIGVRIEEKHREVVLRWEKKQKPIGRSQTRLLPDSCDSF
jgi:hypothetical protein